MRWGRVRDKREGSGEGEERRRVRSRRREGDVADGDWAGEVEEDSRREQWTGGRRFMVFWVWAQAK